MKPPGGEVRSQLHTHPINKSTSYLILIQQHRAVSKNLYIYQEERTFRKREKDHHTDHTEDLSNDVRKGS